MLNAIKQLVSSFYWPRRKPVPLEDIMLMFMTLLLFVAVPHETISAQLTSNKEFSCPNEPVEYECTVQGGRLEWLVTPQGQRPRGHTFFKNIDAIQRTHTISWMNFSSNFTYTSVNDTHMQSTAYLVAVPEFSGTRIDCYATVAAKGSKILWVANELSSVKEITMSLSEASLSLLLSWSEPFPENHPNVVDYYLLGVNLEMFNVTIPMANVTVMTKEPINVTIAGINECFGSSPTAKFLLNLPEGVMSPGGESKPATCNTIDQNTTCTPCTGTGSDRTPALHKVVEETTGICAPPTGTEITGSNVFIISLITSILATSVVSVSITLLLFFVVLNVKVKRSDAIIPRNNHPVYEDIKTVSSEEFGIHTNDAYRL